MMPLTVLKLPVSKWVSHVNVHLYGGVLFDVGADAKLLLKMAERALPSISYVMLTHHHWDHSAALQEIWEATRAVVVAGRAEIEMLLDTSLMIEVGLKPVAEAADLPPSVVEWLVKRAYNRYRNLRVPDSYIETAEGARGLPAEPLATPGHTIAHMSYLVEEGLIVGDLMLADRTPSFIDLEAHLKSLASAPAVRAYPGHGSPIADARRRGLELIRKYSRRLSRLLEACRPKATLKEAVERLAGGRIGPLELLIASREALASARLLEKLGLLDIDYSRKPIILKPTGYNVDERLKLFLSIHL